MVIEEEAGHKVQEVRRIFPEVRSNIFRSSMISTSTKAPTASLKGSLLFRKQNNEGKDLNSTGKNLKGDKEEKKGQAFGKYKNSIEGKNEIAGATIGDARTSLKAQLSA